MSDHLFRLDAYLERIRCTLPTEDARILLYDSELKVRRLDETTTTRLEQKDSYRQTLQCSFGIVLPSGTKLQSPSSQFNILL